MPDRERSRSNRMNSQRGRKRKPQLNRSPLTDLGTRRLSNSLCHPTRTELLLEERFKIQERILDAPDQAAYSAFDMQDETAVYVVFCQNELVWQMIEGWQELASKCAGLKKVIATGDFAGMRFAVYQGLCPDEMLLQDVQIANLEQVTTIVRKLGESIRTLHANYFVYGDLSPVNIAVPSNMEDVTLMGPLFKYISGYYLDDEQAIAVLADLEGINYEQGEYVTPQAYSTYWPYVAPEVCIGDLSPHSDIFSLGGILYWLIVGDDVSFAAPPSYQAAEPSHTARHSRYAELNVLRMQEAFFRQKLMGPVESFAGRCLKMPYGWQKFFGKALSGLIGSRYQDADSFLTDFEEHITPKSVSITVTQEGTGDDITGQGAKPLRNVRVTLKSRAFDWFRISAQTEYESVTDSEGKCEISGIVPGKYVLEARAVRGKDLRARRWETVEVYKDLEYPIKLKKRGIMDRLFRRG